MSGEHTYQIEKLINEAIHEMLLKEYYYNSFKNSQDINISNIVINNGDVIEVYLKIENELHQILNHQLNTIIENINKSAKFHSTEIRKITFKTNLTYRKIGWLRPENLLEDFYKLLDKTAVIGIDYESFVQHFFGDERSDKGIIWYERDNKLAYLFNFLIDHNIISPHDNQYLIVSKHFCNENGVYYNPEKLRKNLGNTITSNNLIQFDYIIKPLKRIFNC